MATNWFLSVGTLLHRHKYFKQRHKQYLCWICINWYFTVFKERSSTVQFVCVSVYFTFRKPQKSHILKDFFCSLSVEDHFDEANEDLENPLLCCSSSFRPATTNILLTSLNCFAYFESCTIVNYKKNLLSTKFACFLNCKPCLAGGFQQEW